MNSCSRPLVELKGIIIMSNNYLVITRRLYESYGYDCMVSTRLFFV